MSNEGRASEGRSGGRLIGARVRVGKGAEKARAASRRVIGAVGDEAVIEVTMLGSSGVGKTTLLASMYERFAMVVGSADLDIVASDPSTSARLQEYITNLRAMTEALTVKGGIAGTGRIREYLFDVGRRGRRPLFRLRFTDYPGNYLTKPEIAAAGESDEVQRALKRADVVLVAIDTPALIAENGKYHQQINTPRLVTDSIVRMLQEDNQRLIILVPLKAERYLADAEGPRNLAKRVEEEYELLLSYLATEEVRSKVACVLAPVQTIGSVVFSYVSEEEGSREPLFHFRAKQMGARYQPVDTDQPLRYALRFIVGKYRATEQRGLMRTMWQQVMGTDTALVTAMQEFAAGCKTDGGFKVEQSHPYLQA
jgi:hypothetical protein